MSDCTKTFYVVRNKEGKFLRSKGYNGYGECWVEGLDKAKVWAKPGPAKAQRTWWLTHFPGYGAPDVIPLVAIIGQPLPLKNEGLRKAQKELASILVERASLEKTISLLYEDMDTMKSTDLKAHAQSGINTYKRMLEKVLVREKTQLNLIRLLEPIVVNSTPTGANALYEEFQKSSEGEPPKTP